VRHQGGATYAFADGHAKWMTPERVFFPPRASASPDHVEKGQKTTAPDPAQLGSASRTGSGYAATFHLR
jgi:prepilin-type processing-associated H-X9-DG protein